MKCLNEKCDKEAVGRSKYCGKTCRALYSKRNRNKAQPISATVIPEQLKEVLEDLISVGASNTILKQAEQSFKAGHSTGKDGLVMASLGIQHPGNTAPTTQNTDEQEPRQCVKSDEVIVNNLAKSPFKGLDDPIIIRDILPEDQAVVFDTMPPEPTRPTGHTTPATAKMTSQQLRTRLSLYHGLDWIASPEYAETIYRLLTLTLDDLKGQSIPAWRQSQEAA